MSNQGTQWVRKSSPSSTKQGPMRATLPVSSLTRQNSNLKKSKSNSPTLSPTSAWRIGLSPDSPLSGCLNYKGKSKTLSHEHWGHGSSIRRTASLDTIYLSGQWPRDSLCYGSGLQLDKATQTEEWVGENRKLHQNRYPEPCASEDKLEKYIRHRLTMGRGERAGLVLAEHGSQTGLRGAGSLPIPTSKMAASAHQRPPHIRSSIEALNQEIERLVLKATATLGAEREEQKSVHQLATPEGHRAPLADILRATTRSVNTQTPAYTGSSQSSGPPSRDSGSPLVVGQLDSSRPPSSSQDGSGDTSPEQEGRAGLGTSPRINRFLAREPPDGCERVSLKFTEDTRRPLLDPSLMDYCPLKPSVNFQLKPSLGSAFLPLVGGSATSRMPPSTATELPPQ